MTGPKTKSAHNFQIGQSGRLFTHDDQLYLMSHDSFKMWTACVDLHLETTNRKLHEWVIPPFSKL